MVKEPHMKFPPLQPQDGFFFFLKTQQMQEKTPVEDESKNKK